ncbi:hypothetical protein [Hymenobacter guriensis]|uniref:DUF308 domain-containing protein n=1 Tax=Hymenobacter guriensis TaxID=2793065 RepID=A0ABS0L783_9BACT|nr:hypothetical protein [Hymenobacter guriensis]MBG8555982.1 hypothetical protein [Hymenobacter guriensis]
MTLPLRTLVRLALITAGILLVPLVLTQFSDGEGWNLFDFIVAGGLIFGTGLAYELVASRRGNTAYRLGTGLALAATLLLIWVNLAVGIIGSEDNPANLLFGSVFLIVFLGAILARLQPRGMARTMLAAAGAQFLVPVVAMLIWRPELTMGVAKVLAANLLFVALWVGAGLLFRQASGPRPEAASTASGAA